MSKEQQKPPAECVFRSRDAAPPKGRRAGWCENIACNGTCRILSIPLDPNGNPSGSATPVPGGPYTEDEPYYYQEGNDFVLVCICT